MFPSASENDPQDFPPFFIVGSGRSGTTLLQTLLDSHPDIAIPPESHIFFRFADIVSCYGDLEVPKNLRALVRDVLSDRKIANWKPDLSVDEFCSQLESKNFTGIIRLLFERYMKRQGKKRWGDKTPRHALFLKEIKTTFPNAKIIHLVRDGRDVAYSYFNVYFGPKRIDKIAQTWRQHVNAVHNFKRELSAEDFLEIQYEKMVENPQRELKTICQFLNVSDLQVDGQVPETKTKSFYVNNKPWHGSLKNSITPDKIGLFKSGLTSRQIEIFETLAQNELRRYGYELLTSANAKVGWLEKLFLSFENVSLGVRMKAAEPGFLGAYCQRLVRKFWRKSAAFLGRFFSR